MLTVRFGQLTVEGLSPSKIHSLAGCSQTQGTPIGPLDFLIAAHALALKATLITNNTGEFLRVPGLVVEDWSKPL